MSAFEEQPCVGLFGTCGDSTFREDLFIPAYERESIAYFNPQVEVGNWQPEHAEEEADHLAYDVVQCWPILSSTYGLGSLAEQGFAIASSLRAPSPFPKFIIPMIELSVDDNLSDQAARGESLRARELAHAHIQGSESPFVYPVESLEEMLAVSISLHGAAKALVELSRAHSPSFRRFVEGRRQQEVFVQAVASGKLGSDISQELNH